MGRHSYPDETWVQNALDDAVLAGNNWQNPTSDQLLESTFQLPQVHGIHRLVRQRLGELLK
jgi:hypothetical protein